MVNKDRALAHSSGSPLALTSRDKECGNRRRMEMVGKVNGVRIRCLKESIEYQISFSIKIK